MIARALLAACVAIPVLSLRAGAADEPRDIRPGQQRGGVDLSEPPAAGKDQAAPTDKAETPPKPIPPEERLAELYARLAKASDLDEAQGIASALERQWLFTRSDTAGLIMSRALEAIQRKELPPALELLDKLVTLEPSWAEAWNKRATARFLADDYTGSMEDIGHVLALDPHHFGALMGMGMILQRSGNDKRALEIFRRVHEIYPALESAQKLIESLAPEVEGRDI
jgi:tetratricopeptide (TPR) repeat protein